MLRAVLGTSLAVVLLGGGSLLVGQALCVLLLGRTAPYAGAVGLAALIVVCDAAVRLPGDATTAAVLAGLLAAGAAVLLHRRGALRPGGVATGVAGITLLGAWIPFLANARVGLPGVSFNNDTAVHLLWAEGLRDERVHALSLPPEDYPLGPHALVAGAAQALHVDLDLALTALLIVVPVLTALAALGALRAIPAPARLVAAPLAGLTYLAASYFVEGAFKETIMAALVLTIAVALEDVARERPPARAGLLLAIPAAGAIASFSYPAAAWIAGTVGLWAAAELLHRWVDAGRGEMLRRARGLLPAAALGTAGVAVLALPEIRHALSLLHTSTSTGGSVSSAWIAPTDLGNLVGPLPFWESLGIWLGPDFRVMPPRGPFNTGMWSAVAALAVAYGAATLVGTRRFALPAALATCGLIYWKSHSGGDSPYVTAKALVIMAPLATTIAGAGLWAPLGDLPGRLWGVRAARVALLAAFTIAAATSSFLALRGAQVGPRATQDQLGTLKQLTGTAPVLFLGRDDYYAWKLRDVTAGSPTYITPVPIELAPSKSWSYGQAFDIDSVSAATLDRFGYVIVPRTRYQSEPPANFRHVADTGLFSLWRRTGPTVQRSSVPGESGSPGAVLDCTTPAGRALAAQPGIARVRPRPVLGPEPPGAITAGHAALVALRLPAGRWRLSIPYVGPQRLTVSFPGFRATLPAMLDRPGPFFELGAITVPPGGLQTDVRLAVDDPAPRGLHSGMHLGTPGRIAAVRTDVPARTVPLRRACGRYVDWYRAG